MNFAKSFSVLLSFFLAVLHFTVSDSELGHLKLATDFFFPLPKSRGLVRIVLKGIDDLWSSVIFCSWYFLMACCCHLNDIYTYL